MPFIEWNDTFSVSVEEIDNQHKKLFRIINELHDSIIERNSKRVIEELLEKLLDYTNYHFKAEEESFEKNGYPGKEKHKEQHGVFVAKIVQFIEDHKQGKMFISIDVMEFLTEWLINHIGIEDQKSCKFLNEQGIK